MCLTPSDVSEEASVPKQAVVGADASARAAAPPRTTAAAAGEGGDSGDVGAASGEATIFDLDFFQFGGSTGWPPTSEGPPEGRPVQPPAARRPPPSTAACGPGRPCSAPPPEMGAAITQCAKAMLVESDEYAYVKSESPFQAASGEGPQLALRISQAPIEASHGAKLSPFGLGDEVAVVQVEKLKGWDALRWRQERSAKQRASNDVTSKCAISALTLHGRSACFGITVRISISGNVLIILRDSPEGL
ncbi:unnamed protein product [Prorocentrum cordatum]|uniref:Uncharacterized protein n=1 Tax=Prorocentrum cordatum TaxID=2364126 RepID=A0ABN9YHX4_9DINO|nr:unnamed protein product [Polarella glacialis]